MQKDSSVKSPLRIYAPEGLYLEIALNKIKTGTVTHKYFYLPTNYYLCRMIVVKMFRSLFLFV